MMAKQTTLKKPTEASSSSTTTTNANTIKQKLLARLRELHFPEPTLEFRFDKTRRWRFDLAWPNVDNYTMPGSKIIIPGICGGKVALEIQGRGRHQTAKGTREDYIKINEAQCQGWIVILATTDMLNNDEVFVQLFDALMARGGIYEK